MIVTITEPKCNQCGHGEIRTISYAGSCLFPRINYHLLKCDTIQCGAYANAWLVVPEISETNETVVFESASHGPDRFKTQTVQVPLGQTGFDHDGVISADGFDPHPNVPGALVADVREALVCFEAGAYNAAAAMARRALERMCFLKGANSSKELRDRVRELVDLGVLPTEMAWICQEVKFWGNLGVHPGFRNIVQADALESVTFVDWLISWIYGVVNEVG